MVISQHRNQLWERKALLYRKRLFQSEAVPKPWLCRQICPHISGYRGSASACGSDSPSGKTLQSVHRHSILSKENSRVLCQVAARPGLTPSESHQIPKPGAEGSARSKLCPQRALTHGLCLSTLILTHLCVVGTLLLFSSEFSLLENCSSSRHWEPHELLIDH